MPTLTALRRVMVRLGRDGLGNALPFGGRSNDVTRLLAALASLRPARDCGVSACIIAVTRAVDLPATVRSPPCVWWLSRRTGWIRAGRMLPSCQLNCVCVLCFAGDSCVVAQHDGSACL